MTPSPVTLDGRYVRLRPLLATDAEALSKAASDGELWNSKITSVPNPETIHSYIRSALDGQANGTELPFVIVQKSSDQIVGTTRYYEISTVHRRLKIGFTWLSASVQRTSVNTEAKLLLLTHAFEVLGAIRVAFLTDALNQRSRAAIVRLGAKEEGILRSHMIMPDGRERDSVYYSILSAEWAEIKARLESRVELRGERTAEQ